MSRGTFSIIGVCVVAIAGALALLGERRRHRDWERQRVAAPPPVTVPSPPRTTRVRRPPRRPARATEGCLLLNEILASNQRTDVDDDGDTSDWVELLNTCDEDVTLKGCALSDDPEEPRKWLFPSVIVPARGFLRVWLSGKDRASVSVEALSRADFGASIERVLVRRGDPWRYTIASRSLGAGAYRRDWHSVDFDDSGFAVGPSGFGYGDGDDATVVPQDTTAVFIRTAFSIEDPGAVAQLVLRIDYDDGFVAYLNGVRVASVNSPVDHPDPSTIAVTKREAGTAELFDLTPHLASLRRGTNVLAIAGINDRPSSDMSLVPELFTVQPVCHVSFRAPRAGGQLLLSASSGAVLDRLEYPEQMPDRSWGRVSGEIGRLAYFLQPTPNAPNGRPFDRPIAGEVTFDPAPGFSTRSITVTARVRDGEELEVRYTTDGTAPDARSRRFSPSARVSRSTVFRAAGFVDGERVTPVVSASYFIGDPPTAPVMSISMDPSHFLQVHMRDEARGRGAERPAFLEVFDEGGALVASTAFGLRLHGGWGRRGGIGTKKSYRAYFRRFYGDDRLRCRIFEDGEVDSFDKLVLRANYNDRFAGGGGHYAVYFRDAVIRDLHRDMGCAAGRGAWYLVYVNMEPKGLFDVTERLDEDFLDSHVRPPDVELLEWDVIKTGNEVLSGTRDEWDALRLLVRSSEPPGEMYREIARRVDLENFTDYMILNIWSQNRDWPHNNWYAARPRVEGGRWIFLSWDAEWGLGWRDPGYNDELFSFVLSKAGRGVIPDLFNTLVGYEEYRRFFEERAERHLEAALSPANALAHVERHRARIDPLIAEEIARFAPGHSPARWRANVERVRHFVANRGAYFRRNMVECFARLGGGVARSR